jgi:hypothetical protein
MATIKIKTRYGKLFTIKILEQTGEYISGYDKFGTFTKILMSDIESCEATGEVSQNGN